MSENKKSNSDNRPYLSLEIELKTDFAQGMHEKYSRELIGGLANASRFVQLYSNNSKEAVEWDERVMGAVDNTIENVKKTMVAVLEDNGITGGSPTFPGKASYEVKSKNPSVKKYLEWIMEMDKAAILVEYAWLTQTITSNQKRKALNNMRISSRRSCRSAKNITNKIKEDSNKKEEVSNQEKTI